MKNKLVQQIALDVLLVFLGGMLVFTASLFLTGETDPIIVSRNLWPTIVFGLLVYGFLLLRLRSRILMPLELLYLHAEEMSRGVFNHFDYPKTNNEIDRITLAMNRMARQLNTVKNASWQDYANVIEHHLAGLRGRDSLSPDMRKELSEISDGLRRMELSFAGIKEAPALAIQSYSRVQRNSPVSNIKHPLTSEQNHGQVHGPVRPSGGDTGGDHAHEKNIHAGTRARVHAVRISPSKNQGLRPRSLTP